MGVKFGQCLRHMIGNVHGHGVKRKIPDIVSTAVYNLAKCQTKKAYEQSLLNLQHLDEEVAIWFEERKDQFATFLFLQENKPCYSYSTMLMSKSIVF